MIKDVIKSTSVNQYPTGIYLLKVKNRNTRTRGEICSKLTKKTPDRYQWPRSNVFIVYFEHVSLCSTVFIDNFEHVIAAWIATTKRMMKINEF